MENRKKLDNRIRTLIENGMATGHRSLFAIVGDKARDQIPILYHILTKSSVSARPSVLWCYKKELSFSSHRKKRMKEIAKKARSSGGNAEIDPFHIFVSATQIRYCYYNETHTILGNTYGMVVLQDFEALTPNLLARTIETVEGGGVVVLLLHSVNSLRQLFTISMDVHSRYRSDAHGEVVPRFNERFILSLASSPAIAALDDHLNILPISSHINRLESTTVRSQKSESSNDEELRTLKEAMKDTKPIGQLLAKCKTADQGKALLRLLDVITEKTLNATCSLTAARGRGKSASLGLALAGAVAFGYTNIFVTSPSPENLRTLFEFVVKGFDAIEYQVKLLLFQKFGLFQEHTDYELIQSTNPEFRKALVRINVFREHRQTIQYIHPTDANKLGQAELVVVDEAAAIPLPLVKDLISGPYLVFLASTINGYEGTGRSLSLKLIQQLKQQAAGHAKGEKTAVSKGRQLYEMTLEESIRYKPGDQIEQWLNKLLCLDACQAAPKLSCGTPPPQNCELYYVNRDTLFSFHKASEVFLHQVMGIYVSAHYKNSPNDLQLLSDAPSHHLFALMAPVKAEESSVPEVLAVIQIALEGKLSKDKVSESLSRGKQAAGDLLPWTVSQNFLDNNFAEMCGARIVRIAVHPEYQGMGYGSRAMKLLEDYFCGKIMNLEEMDEERVSKKMLKTVKAKEAVESVKDGHTVALLEEVIEPRANLPPLLLKLEERQPEKLDYLGTSFGLTLNLLKFWKKLKFVPVYIRQNANDLTGEYTSVMLKTINAQEDDTPWLSHYWVEFRHRILPLLGFEFAKFPAALALSLLQLKNDNVEKGINREGGIFKSFIKILFLKNPVLFFIFSKFLKILQDLKKKLFSVISRENLSLLISNTDLKRLSQYARNLVDHQLITDLYPIIARLYFDQKLPKEVTLPVEQSAVLLAFGLQHKTANQAGEELGIPQNQIWAIHSKAIRKLSDCFDSICEDAIRRQIEGEKIANKVGGTEEMRPLDVSLAEELDVAAKEIKERQKRDRETLMSQLGGELSKYEITADQKDLEEAFGNVNMKFSKSIVSVKSKRSAPREALPEEFHPTNKKLKGKKKFRN
ncbi:hypothetical protein WR25_26277 [Diploscapter pachys]|uniref:RNA cytidine acetyltransferase n=1 Tax=Diploscapter pachys TaxID=2018661 RepID=A0A2A2LEM7_9BILA|nr:hypothetical protein WR25_26277 [Diploscapter pachys]